MKTGQARPFKHFKLYGKTKKYVGTKQQTKGDGKSPDIDADEFSGLNAKKINETKEGKIFPPGERNRAMSLGPSENHKSSRKTSSIKILPKNLEEFKRQTRMKSMNKAEPDNLKKSPSPFKISSEEEEGKPNKSTDINIKMSKYKLKTPKRNPSL